MLTVKGYRIPKYLYKRKIEIIKTKIIKRKYGYLFYRKTISKILPSQAKHYYEKNLLKKAFFEWVMIWYEEKITWKLLVKAEIHYRYNLMQKMLEKWKHYNSGRKLSKLKWKIAQIHSQKIYKRQTILQAFNKWKFYRAYKVYRKMLFKMALNFFKSKYKKEQLKIFLQRWVVFTRAARKSKIKIKRAKKQYEYRAKDLHFKKLLLYKNMKKKDKELIKKMLTVSEIKIKKKTIVIWQKFVELRQHIKQNLMLSGAHYIFKLKYQTFNQLMYNKNRNKLIKQKLNIFNNYQNEKNLRKYFFQLTKYKNYRKLEIQKEQKAYLYHNKTLQKKILVLWKNYTSRKRLKKLLLEEQVLKIKSQILLAKKQFLFKKWKKFCTLQLIKRQKLLSAKTFADKMVVKQYFKAWLLFIKNQKLKKVKMEKSHKYYEKNLLRKVFIKWKTFSYDNKSFKQKLQEAKNYYKAQLKKDALYLIIKAGVIQKEVNFIENKCRINHQLFLAHKYFSIWKRKAIYKKAKFALQASCLLDENKENMVEAANIDWYPVCFLAPRTFKS